MKKILYGIITALILITIILACTNPSLQNFTDYIEKKKLANRTPHYTVHRENCFIFSIFFRSGGGQTDGLSWSYGEIYIAIFGRFYLFQDSIAD